MNICIVGTGYVGLVTAACFAEMGNDVTCVDVNPDIVASLKKGRVHIFEPGLEELVGRNYAEGRLFFTTSLDEGMDNALFVFITVGTPCKDDGTCDLSYVHKVAEEIGGIMKGRTIVVDKSTVPVGTADQVRSIIAAQLAARGEDIPFDVVSNPEFLKEGDAVGDFMKPDRVIVGTDSEESADLLKELYAPFARSREKLLIMGVRSAEMTKYAANCMLAAKISFINEVANICDRVGADVGEVRLGIGSDHRIGYQFIYPGIGYGGSCFPKDVKALIATADDHAYDSRLIRAVDEVNTLQKSVLPQKVMEYFKKFGGVEGKTLALWGLAFKPNTDDIREAPSIELIRTLTEAGMNIQAFDPVAYKRAAVELAGNDRVRMVGNQYEACENADALAVVTEWNQFRNPDFDRIRAMLGRPAVFDGRNLYNPRLMRKQGWEYFGIGRS